MIHGTGVTCRHVYKYSHATDKTDLAFCIRYEDDTSGDGEQHTASDQKLEAEAASEQGH